MSSSQNPTNSPSSYHSLSDLLLEHDLESTDHEEVSNWSQDADESPTRRPRKRRRLAPQPWVRHVFTPQSTQDCITVDVQPRGPSLRLPLDEIVARARAPPQSVQPPQLEGSDTEPSQPPLKRRRVQVAGTSSSAQASPGDDEIKASSPEGSLSFSPGAFQHLELEIDGLEVLPSLVKDWFTYQDQVSQAQIPPETITVSSQIAADRVTAETEREEGERAEEANAVGDQAAVITESELRWEDLTGDKEADPEAADSTQEPVALPDARTKLARRYEELMQSSLIDLITAIIFDERQVSTTFKSGATQFGPHWIHKLLLPILTATDDMILHEIINGNLARASRQDPVARDILRKMIQKGNSQPAIYMQLLVDDHGLSPSPAKLTEMIKEMRSYCSLTKTATRIHRGELKYLSGSSTTDYSPSTSHITNIAAFANNLEARLENLRDTQWWSTPLDTPLVEVGYAASPKERLEQHRDHRSSNYIMNLAEAICKVLYGNKYRIMQFVIFHIFNKSQAAAAEVLFTRLAQGYIEDGGGFSHALAGRSNHSALSVRSLEWDRFLKEAVKNTGLIDRMDRETDKLIQVTAAICGKPDRHAEQGELQERRAAIEEKTNEVVTSIAELDLDAERIERAERAELMKRRKKVKELSLRLRLHEKAMKEVLG
ncbi:hypothetical protein MMC18_006929 [Xylographa bjoerkii]|nr:hypothetical protein [Xylographa bjoerkii]